MNIRSFYLSLKPWKNLNILGRSPPFEKLKAVIIPVFVFIFFSLGLAVFTLNIPISSEKLHGTLIRFGGTAKYKSATYAIAFIELDNGRTVSAPLQYGANWPKEGDSVAVVRYIKRFFGDSFGLVD